jgi:hypothetical protein
MMVLVLSYITIVILSSIILFHSLTIEYNFYTKSNMTISQKETNYWIIYNFM